MEGNNEPRIYDLGKGNNNGKVDPVLKSFIENNLERGTSDLAKKYCEDPTVVGFNLFFYFDYRSPLLNGTDKGENAVAYLKNIKEPDRAAALERFRTRLKELTEVYPYYLQELSGLEDIYAFDPKNAFDERVLSIKTLESIDMKMAGLIQDYIYATWDFEYRRNILPANMREFEFSVIISEIRNIRTFVKAAGGTGEFKDINDKLAMFEYYFTRCEFDFRQGNTFTGTINNATPEVATNSFKINCGQLLNFSSVPLFDIDGEAFSGNNQSNDPQNPSTKSSRLLSIPAVKAIQKAGQGLVNDFKDKAENFGEKALQELENQAGQLAQKYLTDPIISTLGQAQWGNLLFRGEKPNINDLLTGDQTLADINPLKGRVGNVGSAAKGGITSAFTGRIVEEIDKGKNFLNNDDGSEKEKRIKELLSGSIPLFKVDPLGALVNNAIITTLGQLPLVK